MQAKTKLLVNALKFSGLKVLRYDDGEIRLPEDVFVELELERENPRDPRNPVIFVAYFKMRDEDGDFPIEIGRFGGPNRTVNLVTALKRHYKKR